MYCQKRLMSETFAQLTLYCETVSFKYKSGGDKENKTDTPVLTQIKLETTIYNL